MLFMEKMTDKFGWEYYPGLPQEYIPATIDDFHVKRKLKIGLHYLIKWADQEYYEVRKVKEDLKREWLLPFIQINRVFILKSN
jgi:hypothetical protein